ncbi:uncharacterized protein LOC112345640 [Selaginella moellendorffii]|uniref:uncharacterized protein LOC112345640 n=1 Tax=Selaginella moellendorffii TaxID=88036 RepID=UPI000D1D0A0C|nr:uncharacterized protein LOC112345640 [Selaginella moellendorffii]|eukprot:XP_024528601.1 uncharacterized protein LOC112345640 [Selaginella moellendorffii]
MQYIPFGLHIPDIKKRFAIHHAVKRYIEAGHHDSVIRSGCRIRDITPPKRIRCKKIIPGPHHHPVPQRSVITGKLGPKDNIIPPRCALGPQLLSPGGHYNEDVIDGRFIPKQLKPDKITIGHQPFKKEEVKDNFFKVHQARQDHATYKLRTHAALTEFLYEAKDRAGEVFNKDEFSKVRPSTAPAASPAKPLKK